MVWVRAGTTTISGLSSYRSDLFIRLLYQLCVLLQCNCDSLYVMMTCEGVKVQFHEFRSLILGGSEWAASRCSHLSPGKGVLLVLNFETVCSRAVLDSVEKAELLRIVVVLSQFPFLGDKGKGGFHPRTGHEGSEGECKYVSILSLTLEADGGGRFITVV